MLLVHARVCCNLECNEVFDARLHRACPRCSFSLTMPLSTWLNRKPVERVQGHCRVP